MGHDKPLKSTKSENLLSPGDYIDQGPETSRVKGSQNVAEGLVGIDLGTTNSLVAFINREGKAEIIINERGDRLTPSVVHFKSDQEVMVGELARSQMILKPDRTVSCIKRHMGFNYEAKIQDRGYTPPEVSALVLRKLVQYAEKFLGQNIESAVVTVPAYFNDNQRQATLVAGELAGIKIIQLLNEPTAAALAYGADSDNSENVLVLDIGGGTFDITLMEQEHGLFQVICTGGSTSLGGIDFDNRLVDFIIDSFKQTEGIDLTEDKIALQQIQINAEKAKVDLSTVQECSILIPYITMGANGPIHLNQSISRNQLSHICRDLFVDIRLLIEKTLKKGNVDAEWVDVVVLAGGASRMPGFRAMVDDMFGSARVKSEINPDEVVALGAAIEAGMLTGEIDSIELLDVTSQSLGIEDDQGDFVTLVPANTSYPVSRSSLFTTVVD
ncbi:MAG: Hsp70 family protein, partial [Chitinophagales bacterium]